MMQGPAPVARGPIRGAAAALGPVERRWAAVRDYRGDERLAVPDWTVPDGVLLPADPDAVWISAGICGDLYGRRPGAAPGLRLRASAAPVRFRILCSHLLPGHLPFLDARADPDYRRVTADCDYRGLVLRTQIYVLKEAGLY